MINLINVSKRYGSIQALRELTLELHPGKIVGLCGPNGAGKTTLIKILTGLIQSYEGQVRINDQAVSASTKQRVAYLPDVNFIDPKLNAQQAKALFADLYESFNPTKFDALLDQLKLNPKQRFSTLSKGMKEKLQLALVMARDADVYILDEPIGGVDPAARELILNTILDNYNPNALVLISTHLISDIEHIFDQVIFLKEGQIHTFEDAEVLRQRHHQSVDATFREVFK